MADIFFSAQRLEAIAASKVINIFYSIQCILRKHRYALCYCHYKLNCHVCILSNYPSNFYKSFARRDFKALVSYFNEMLKTKKRIN